MLTHVDALSKDVNLHNFEQNTEICVIQSLSLVSVEARNTYGVALALLKMAKLGYDANSDRNLVIKIMSLKSNRSVFKSLPFLFNILITKQAEKSFSRFLPTFAV
jgi:hypothetical protein